jgi:hypothetical protein
MPDERDKGATSIYRMTRSGGFDGRVMPIWHDVTAFAGKMGLLERYREKKKIRSIVDQVNRTLESHGTDPGDWHRGEGEVVVHLHVERIGLLEELRQFVREEMPARAREMAHLMSSREKGALFIPVEFARPMLVRTGAQDIPVGSTPALLRELDMIGAVLDAEGVLALPEEAKRVVADKAAVEKFESRATYDPLFWKKFAHMIYRKLAKASRAHRLPIVLS